ncbi:hypothetical protein Voc01_057310 [Virgisporangium ochraceum]|uniref:Uncharacterized protein n=2 Tax=Virgisporangium ochraceum TaxID=65505 RepID=A0A8J3ZVN5_9ACTN|nr:hypothetical protein Voc01_057310 [Virgisporangium ochraceum]
MVPHQEAVPPGRLRADGKVGEGDRVRERPERRHTHAKTHVASSRAVGAYPATMNIAGRTLGPAVLHAGRPDPPDLAVLPPFFTDLLHELPWWNRTWRVTEVQPAYPREFTSGEQRRKNRFTEVSVPGTLDGGTDRTLPFFARALGIPEADLAAVAGVDGVDAHRAG